MFSVFLTENKWSETWFSISWNFKSLMVGELNNMPAVGKTHKKYTFFVSSKRSVCTVCNYYRQIETNDEDYILVELTNQTIYHFSVVYMQNKTDSETGKSTARKKNILGQIATDVGK